MVCIRKILNTLNKNKCQEIQKGWHDQMIKFILLPELLPYYLSYLGTLAESLVNAGQQFGDEGGRLEGTWGGNTRQQAPDVRCPHTCGWSFQAHPFLFGK